MKNLFNYIKNSNLSFTLVVNPFGWRWLPNVYCNDSKEWTAPKFQLVIFWLFLKISIYIDDGAW